MTAPGSDGRLTRLLQAASAGDDGARSQILELVYAELRRIARSRLAGERRDHTLRATDLVHEAYLRLVGPEGEVRGFANRAEFFFAAGEAMRRVLLDHARKRGRFKRGGGAKRVALDVLDLAAEEDPEEIEALDHAIEKLREWDPHLGKLVHLRFYVGLSVEETAKALGSSPRTVKREWTFARAWLCRELGREPEAAPRYPNRPRP